MYYRCTRDAKKASGDCPIKNISADTVERFVYEQLGRVLRRDDVVGFVTGGDAVKRADFMEATKDMDDFWARMNPGEREISLGRILAKSSMSKIATLPLNAASNTSRLGCVGFFNVAIVCCLMVEVGVNHSTIGKSLST